MKFNRSTLRKAVDTAIKADKAQQDAEDKARANEYLADLGKWNLDHHEEWAKAIPKIRAKLKSGNGVTGRDLPTSRYGDRNTFSSRHGLVDTPTPRAYHVRADLKLIANVLDLITDDEVTDTALARLGVRPHVLRTLALMIPVEVKD